MKMGGYVLKFKIWKISLLFSFFMSPSIFSMTMNTAPRMGHNSAIRVSNDLWHITLPNGLQQTYTANQINQIINNMPADIRAQLTQDVSALPSYIQNNNINSNSQETIDHAAVSSTSSMLPQHL